MTANRRKAERVSEAERLAGIMAARAMTRRRVIFLAVIGWVDDDGTVQHGGWVVLEGRGCVQEIVAGPFATREEAERAT